MQPIIENIAKKTLGMETLETRNSDRLDFKEVAVWSVKEALEQAYAAGFAKGEAAVENRDVKGVRP